MSDTKTHFVQAVRDRVGEVVVGQDVVVERMMIALLTGGHLLLLGVPGTAKTLLVNAVAKAVDLQFSRVQFTIDMLPSDIIGSELLDQATGKFRTHQGPVFTNLLLADEINRAAPKVQSALLEAMQERKVTIGNASYPLPLPFLVIATQNPIEQAGTFELPEAQLDRFMLCHRLNYPTADQEEEVLRRQLKMGLKRVEGGAMPKTAFDMIGGEPVCRLEDLVSAMEQVQAVHVSEVFMKHCVEFVRLTRSHPAIELGCSPRAGLSIVQAARARAFVMQRDYVVPEDLFELAEDVVLHRIRLSYEALAEGRKPEQVLEDFSINSVDPPMRTTGTLTHDPLDARQFEIAVRRLANALTYGQESSPFLGAGIEYVQSRLYQSGDPVKFIDWRITGRTGRFHVKEYEAPKQMPVYLLVDTSASMCVSSLRMSKYAWAVQIAGGIALAAVEHMNPVGLMTVGERDLHQTPSLSRGSILQWLHLLRHYHFTEGTMLGKRVRELIPRVEQRCLFVIISDLHDPDAIPAIKLMAHDHDCAVLHLEDPAERGGIRGGIIRAVEAETGREFVAHGRSKFLSAEDTHTLARAGVDYLHLPTDEPIVPRLRHFLKNRKSRRRTG